LSRHADVYSPPPCCHAARCRYTLDADAAAATTLLMLPRVMFFAAAAMPPSHVTIHTQYTRLHRCFRCCFSFDAMLRADAAPQCYNVIT